MQNKKGKRLDTEGIWCVCKWKKCLVLDEKKKRVKEQSIKSKVIYLGRKVEDFILLTNGLQFKVMMYVYPRGLILFPCTFK